MYARIIVVVRWTLPNTIPCLHRPQTLQTHLVERYRRQGFLSWEGRIRWLRRLTYLILLL